APSTAGEYETKTRYDLFYEPDELVSLEDIFDLTRSRYEGTEYCPDETGESIRIIGIERQVNCAVIQTYTDLPAAMCAVTWNTVGNADNNVYLPMSNLITDVAEMFDYIPEDYSGSSYRLDIAMTHFKRLTALAEQDRVMYAGVSEYWKSLESSLAAEMPSILADLAELYAEDPEAAAESITAYTIEVQEQALEDADTMFDELVWYIIANTNTMPTTEQTPFITSLMEAEEVSEG
ncbi:MAG: C69 family dipeptidase, partial [Oscillospiraceae bacterium]|nr:C69 family dipeptidase [Oscillospiraceae bacterium]